MMTIPPVQQGSMIPPVQQGSMISKTIGTMNRLGILKQPIKYDEVAEMLESIGEKNAGMLLHEIRDPSIRDPTAWLKGACARVARGEGAPPSRQGQAYRNPPVSQYVSKAVGMLNHEDILQQPIMFREVAPYLCGLPDSRAIELVQHLRVKAAEVKDPTNWLIAAAKKSSMHPTGGKSNTSKMVGELNQKNVLVSPVMWSTVSGPMLLISAEEASALLKELEQKASEVKDPTNWLFSAATKVLKAQNKKPDGLAGVSVCL
jgi:hypothetical protein